MIVLSLNSNKVGLKYGPKGERGAHDSVLPSDNWSWYKNISTKMFWLTHHNNKTKNALHFHCLKINMFLL
jgi:hypothetical protein